MTNTNKLTITQVAEKYGVSEQAAYGLMQFLKEIGHVEVTEAPSNGKRGRRPKLYELTAIAEMELDMLRGVKVVDDTKVVPDIPRHGPMPETTYIGPLG